MGWFSIITSDTKITEELLDSILESAPPELKSQVGLTEKQSFGWHMATNVRLDNSNQIRIGGSWSMSGHVADPMRNFLKKELKKHGHKIRTTKPQ